MEDFQGQDVFVWYIKRLHSNISFLMGESDYTISNIKPNLKYASSLFSLNVKKIIYIIYF